MKLLLLTFFCSTLLIFDCSSQSFNYYYGNIHSQSSYSDGNKDSATSLITKPLQDFNYAKLSLHTDFYGISDHNHQSAGMTSPLHFHSGLADANIANNDGVFVAMYGQEWGVISGGGHVIVYGYDSLMGWDAGDYDVFVAQNNYTTLWSKINAKVGAFGYLAHPQVTDYTNLFTTTINASADNAIIGMAARSGPAFSTNTAYSDPSTSDYIARYNEALSLGYHLGVGLDHDTHNSVFGRQTAGRLVVLAPSLTRNNILYALRKMHFYSSDDWNAKVDFNINSQPMGSIYTHSTTPTLNVSITDPDVEIASSITVYYGVPGSSSLPTVLTSTANSNTLSFNHNITNLSTYYYYLEILQPDGDKIWTSPIWYTRNNTYTANAPITNFSVSAGNHCVGQAISLTDISTNSPTGWMWTTLGATTSSASTNNTTVTYTAPGNYVVTLLPTNTTGTGLPLTQTITVVNAPNVVVSSATVCNGQSATLNASGATTYSWNTSASTASISVTPISTTQYTVIGTSAGCSKSATTSVIVNPSPTLNIVSNPTAVCAGQNATMTVSGAATYTWNTGSNSTSIFVSPASTTQYTVTGTSSGCSKIFTTTLIVNPTPTISVISNPTSLCVGQTGSLSVTGATTYSWSTGGTTAAISVTPASTTQYTVTGTSAGCSKSATTSVIVSPSPTLNIISNPASICAGQSSSLSVSGASTYSWSTGATATSISVTPVSTIQYTVTGTSAGCSKSATTSVIVNPSPTLNVIANPATLCPGQSSSLSVSGASTYSWSTGATTASISVTPVSTIQYTVTGTSAGCSKSASTSVIVNPSPTLNVIANPATICAGQTASLSVSGATTYSWNTSVTSPSIIVTPLLPTQYSVTGTIGGCSKTVTTSINVNPNPTLSVVSNPTVLCIGQSALLTANGASTYTWNTGPTTSSILVSPSSNTTYSVNGTSLNGCKNAVSISINVNPLPIINVITNNSVICVGQNATLTANGANTYTWNTGSNNNSISVTPTISTSYTVNGTNTNGCNNNSTITQNVSVCTGLSSANENEGLSVNIYPNPMNSILNVELGVLNKKDISFQILNSLGELLLEKALIVEHSELDLQQLPNGLYFIRIFEKSSLIQLQKLIKE